MDLQDLMNSLQQASDIDLLRLRTGIDHLLQNPARILAIRQRLHLGQEVQYLSMRENRMRPGRVIEFRPHEVLIQAEDKRCWWLHYAAINVDLSMAPPPQPKKPDRSEFATGETVSFEGPDLIQRLGTIVRINQKTATLSCDGQQWRVSFALLRHVVDL